MFRAFETNEKNNLSHGTGETVAVNWHICVELFMFRISISHRVRHVILQISQCAFFVANDALCGGIFICNFVLRFVMCKA